MDIHKNARLTLRSREALAVEVLSGMRLTSAARRFLVTPKTAAKWWRAIGPTEPRAYAIARPGPSVVRLDCLRRWWTRSSSYDGSTCQDTRSHVALPSVPLRSAAYSSAHV